RELRPPPVSGTWSICVPAPELPEPRSYSGCETQLPGLRCPAETRNPNLSEPLLPAPAAESPARSAFACVAHPRPATRVARELVSPSPDGPRAGFRFET